MVGDRLEWVQRQAERLNAGDLEGFLDELGPDFEFTPDPSFPDAGTYSGDEFRRFMAEWNRVWEDISYEMRGVEERDTVLIVDSRWNIVLKQTGAPAVWDFSLVIQFDGDRGRRMWGFFDRDSAEEKAAELTG